MSEYSPEMQEEIKRIVQRCAVDPMVDAKFFYPDFFFTEFNSLHKQIYAAIMSPHKKIVIAAPRGLGKTSICKGFCAQAIRFRLFNFIVYTSNSGDNAIIQTESIKNMIQANPRTKELFGTIKAHSQENELDLQFTKKAWTAYDTYVLPRGRGQQIRGLLNTLNKRPDLFIFDDLEDKESIESELMRAKDKEWFSSDCEKAISQFDPNYKMIYIDTLKHEDSLLQTLMDSSDWHTVHLSICDEEYNSLAEDYMTTEEVKESVEIHREKGQLDVFYREYMNMPISKEDPVFDQKNFRHFTDGPGYLQLSERSEQSGHSGRSTPDGVSSSGGTSPIYGPRGVSQHGAKGSGAVPFGMERHDWAAGRVREADLLNVVIVDPAKTVKMQSADSAIVGVGVHRESHKIFLREVDSGKMYPDELYDGMFAMTQRLGAQVLAVETTSLHEFIEQPIKNEKQKRNVQVMLEWLQARGKKEDRIAALSPYYRQGYIYHNATCSAKIEQQLMGYPRSKLWDVMDAFAYIVLLMDKLNWMFDPPGGVEDMEEGDDAYRELRNEPDMIYETVI